MKKLFLVLMTLLSIAKAQSFYRLSPPAPGGVLRLCAVTDGNPCATPQPIFGDQALTQQILQPVQLGQDGNYGFWTLPGQYILQISSPFNRIEVLNLAGPTPSVIAPGNAAVTVNPPAIPFGTVQSLQFSGPQLVTIANTGAVSVTITSVSYGVSSPFSNVVNPNPCLVLLVPGASCVFSSQYQPQSPGANDSGTLTVTTTAPLDVQNPLTVALTGKGQAGATFQISLIGLSGQGSGTIIDTNNANALNAIFNAGVCTGVCSFSYPTGATVILTATPFNGSTFGIFGAGLGPSPATLTVTQTQTISALFNLTPPNVTLNLVATGQGGGAITTDIDGQGGPGNCNALAGVVTSGGGSGCSIVYPQGSVVNVTATPNASSTLVGFTGSSNCSSTSPCGPITLNTNLTLSVNFGASSSTVQPSLIQTTTNCPASGTTIACVWAQAQQVNDLNLCFGAWPDNTTTVVSLTDTGANTYTQVPTASPKTTTGLTQVAYYAQNISAASAGARTTTMTLSTSIGSAITIANLTHGHSTTATNTFNTASITPAANQPVMVATSTRLASGNGPGAISSITGNSITYTKVISKNYGITEGTGRASELEVWCGAAASPTTGAITITNGVNPASIVWIVDQSTNAATTCASAIGISAIAGINAGAPSPLSVTMGTFGASTSATYGAGAIDETGNGLNAASNMTSIVNDNIGSNSNQMTSEYNSGNISPVTETYTGGTNNNWGIFGVEIKAPSSRRDMRCLEYAGIKQSGNPLDVTSVAAVGSSSSPSSGGLTTVTGNDVVVGATASTSSTVNSVSTNYTQRIKNSFGDDVEDQESVPPATYPFAPALAASSNWIATQLALLAQSTAIPTVFSFTIVNGGNGNGTVTSSTGAPNLNCVLANNTTSGACSTQVSANSSMTATANPSPGSVFVSWQGPATCGTSPVCVVPNITNSQNAIATFTTSGVTQYFVNHSTGADSNDGLAATVGGGHGPWLTIGHAAAAAQLGASGTLITVAHNTYTETVTLSKSGTSTARYAFVCDAAWTVGGSTGCAGTQWFTMNVNNVDIGALPKLGFEYTSASQQVGIDDAQPACGGFTCATGNGHHYLGNYLHDIGQSVSGGCPSSGAILVGQHAHPSTGLVVAGNLIDHMGTYPSTTCNTMQGIYATALGAVIENNQISRVAAGAIQYYDCEQNGVISNNTVFNNHVGMIITGSNGCTPGNTTVSNNIVVNNLSFAFNNNSPTDNTSSPGHQVLYTNNDTFGNPSGNFTSTPAATTLVQGGLSENPTSTFVNYTGDPTGDYRLKGTSILINAGTTQCVPGGQPVCTPSVDLLNVARPQRANYDVGAYELP